MIDIYVPEGLAGAELARGLLQPLCECLLAWTDASEIAIARENSGAYLHLVPDAHVTAGGVASAAVRIDVRVPEVVLSTLERRRGFIRDATAIVESHLSPQRAAARTWVTISNTVDGGWGIAGHAMTNAELDEF